MNTHLFGPAQGTRLLNPRGKQTAVAIGSLCLCLWVGASRASTLDFTPLPTDEILLAQRAIADTEVVAVPAPPKAPSTALPAPTEVHKSAGRAFIYDVLVPGAGHLYAGNKRGWAHLGLEGVAWATFFYYHERGTSKEDQYLAYADDHWDYTRWVSSCNCQGSPEDSLIVYFRANNKQHYYEDIGKLNTYSQGWDAAGNRNFYRGMRGVSNNFLKDAQIAVMGSFVNRIVSAVDILRLLKRETHDLLGADTQLRLKIRSRPFADQTSVGFEIRKQL